MHTNTCNQFSSVLNNASCKIYRLICFYKSKSLVLLLRRLILQETVKMVQKDKTIIYYIKVNLSYPQSYHFNNHTSLYYKSLTVKSEKNYLLFI